MIRIIKLGGSLLDTADLPNRFSNWLGKQSPAKNVIIVGGGNLVDCVRRWDDLFSLDQSFVHYTCIELMSNTARLFCQLMPQLELLSSIQEIQEKEFETGIFDVAQFARHQQGLPESWDVTSDSIAASLAIRVGAEQLCLLKSALPTSPRLRQWSDTGFVDRYFANLAERINSVVAVDLSRPGVSPSTARLEKG